MSPSFADYSIRTAQKFIHSILFVDDKAYSPNQTDHPFDVRSMIRESASKGLVATAYSPEQSVDLDAIADIGKKVDVLVLDWRIDFTEQPEPGQDDDEEEDAADRRGHFAMSVIKKLIASDDGGKTTDQLKLIFIYTGETGLQDIRTDLSKAFPEFTSVDAYTLCKGGIRISIWAKESLTHTFKHVPENRARIRTYSQLIDEVATEYVMISSGLMSNICISALTCLRNNTYKLLAKFSAELDPAFAAHRAMLLNPENAGELLKDIICEELNAILTNENISSSITDDTINKWIDSQEFKDITIALKGKKNAVINNEKRKLWQSEGYVSLLKKELDEKGSRVLTDDEIDNFERYHLLKCACSTFTPANLGGSCSNEEFSILTHHRRNSLSSTSAPNLTLGTVIKCDNSFYLCIQQKCDSVRIPVGEPRNFLFLPMIEATTKFDVLHKVGPDDYLHLSIMYKNCHSLQIFGFAPLDDSGTVQAQKEGDNFFFTSCGGEATKYQWILDLKDAHAQRMVNNFAAQLARVGLDESEWLRRA